MRGLLKYFLAVFVGYVGGHIALHHKLTHIPEIRNGNSRYEWSEAPTVIVCYKDFPSEQLYRAIKYWENNGEQVGPVVADPPKTLCDVPKISGAITIRKAPERMLQGNAVAITQRHFKFTYKISSAVIYFSGRSLGLDLVMEHELGHALGFNHMEIVGNVMHPTWENMGPKFYPPQD